MTKANEQNEPVDTRTEVQIQARYESKKTSSPWTVLVFNKIIRAGYNFSDSQNVSPWISHCYYG